MTSLLSRVGQAMSNIVPMRPNTPYPLPSQERAPTEMYGILRAYYSNNSLYDTLAVALNQQGIWREALKGLRNPAFRSVEFYTAKLWPGSLEQAFQIQSKNLRIAEQIQRVWMWSNWEAKKQVAARTVARSGDLFIKVATKADKQSVYFQLIEPDHVTDLDLDELGFVTYIRIDVPKADRATGPATEKSGGTMKTSLHTEVWDKSTMLYRSWEQSTKTASDGLDQLGPPKESKPFSEMGIDFIPIVHAPFRDVGEDRGVGCFTLALDKIDEANRLATRLHQMLFRHNDATWALGAGGNDASGRPLPPVQVSEGGTRAGDADVVEIGDSRFLRLPGNATLQSLVPDIKYEAALLILQDHMLELQQDLPELAYYRSTEHSDLSGRALRLMLGAAIDRVIEARGNAQAALIRANQMALTMGAAAKIDGFSGLGNFQHGDLAHTFADRPVLTEDPLDQAEGARAEGQAFQAWTTSDQMPVEMAYAEVKGIPVGDPRLEVFTKERLEAIQRAQAVAVEDAVPPVAQ